MVIIFSNLLDLTIFSSIFWESPKLVKYQLQMDKDHKANNFYLIIKSRLFFELSHDRLITFYIKYLVRFFSEI